jgi:hypothetical protein
MPVYIMLEKVVAGRKPTVPGDIKACIAAISYIGTWGRFPTDAFGDLVRLYLNSSKRLSRKLDLSKFSDIFIYQTHVQMPLSLQTLKMKHYMMKLPYIQYGGIKLNH